MPTPSGNAPFEPERLYRTTDPELRSISARSTLAHWRHQGVGPRYMCIGSRVLYRGSDLNRFFLPGHPSSENIPTFEPARIYRPRSESLRLIASVVTLARWRSQGIGPHFTRIGTGIYYLGSDLNRFLDDCYIETRLLTRQNRAPSRPINPDFRICQTNSESTVPLQVPVHDHLPNASAGTHPQLPARCAAHQQRHRFVFNFFIL